MLKLTRKKRTEPEKTDEKDGKPLYKLMNNVIYSKTAENLRNKTFQNFLKEEKDYGHKNRAKYFKEYLTMIKLQYAKINLH